MSADSASSLIVPPTDGLPMGRLPAHHAARDPRRLAVVVGETKLTREAFDVRSTRRARMLTADGVKAGDFVTIALPNGVEFYETSFAVWKLGAIPNVVSYRLPKAEIAAIVDLAKPSLVIGPAPDLLPGANVVAAGRLLDESLSAEALPDQVSPHWKAMTSGGSTGRPKIIVDQAPGVWSPIVPILGQAVDDTILNPGPLYHNAPFIGMHCGLFVGATVVDMVKFDPRRTLELIDEWKVGWINLVPTMMHRIWQLGEPARREFDLSSLRVVFHMAAPCPPWLKQAWIDWLRPERIFELYGGTERQGATVITGTEWLAHRGSVGKPQTGSRIRILNDQGADCAPGEIGEIYFLPDAGPGATYHYVGAEAKRLGQWESLGDLGHFDADGYLYLADRRTDLILSGGANIYPAEVEAAIDAHPQVRSSIVVGLPDDEWGQIVHAIVQIDRGDRLTEADIVAHASQHLARYKLPKSVEFTHDNLRDDAGKARRSALKAERSKAR